MEDETDIDPLPIPKFEHIVQSLDNAGQNISLPLLHLNYKQLARMTQTKRVKSLMKKIQKFAADKFGSDCVPGEVLMMDINNRGNTGLSRSNTNSTFSSTNSLNMDLSETEINTLPPPEIKSTTQSKENLVNLTNSESNGSEIENEDANFTIVENKKRKLSKSKIAEKNKKKTTNEDKIKVTETKNSFQPLAKLPTDEVTLQIPPVIMKKIDNYKLLLKRWNENLKFKCTAKPIGEFMYVYPATDQDHRNITTYLDNEKLEYYVIPQRKKKPIKIVIKKLDINTPTEEIKDALIELGFRVAQVNQLKKIQRQIPPTNISSAPTDE